MTEYLLQSDHRTTYAKQPSRNDYYDIALQAVTGDTVDYLAGGGFKKPDGDGTQDNLLDLAAENGWTITTTAEEVRALNAESGRVLATNPVLQDSASILYEIDRIQKAEAGEDVLSLADFVRSGINVLDNENGFFIMCEGGKIDWAGHANDAATSIYDTIALSDAVQVAIDFAAEHPDETLIIVTVGDDDMYMTWVEGDEVNTVHIGLDGEYRWDNIVIGKIPYTTCSTGCWNSESELEVHIRCIEVPSERVIKFKINGDNVIMRPSSNPDVGVMAETLKETVKDVIKQPGYVPR